METYFPDLKLLADYTNITSILVIIFCSVAVGMPLFIYFFGLTGDLSHRTVDFRPQQRSMVKVSNPFVLELDESTRELGDVLTLNLSTLCPCHVVVVWGPKIQALHDLILTPGRTIRKGILTDLKHNTDLQPFHSDILRLETEGKHTVALPTPECVSSEALGNMPRIRYPVAVFVFTPETSGNEHDALSSSDNCHSHDNEEEKDNAIIGLFAIIHLKDETVTKNTHIIGKYVKTAGIPIYSLQALYVSSIDQPPQTTILSHGDNLQSHQYNNQSHQPFTSSLRHRNTSNISRSTSCVDNERTESVHRTSEESTQHQRNENCSQTNKKNTSTDRDFHLINHASVDNTSTCDDCSDFLDGQTAGLGENQELNQHSECGHVDSGDRLPCDVSRNVPHPDPIYDCVVCQTNSIKCALLPCRHSCVCLRCFRLLDKCPMCRGTIESYFIVRGEQNEDSSDDEDEDEEEKENERILRQGIAAQVENMFERLNQMVGFA